MIFPFLDGIMNWTKTPVTWLLFGFCTIVFSFSFNTYLVSQKTFESELSDEFFLKSQGRLYSQFIERNSHAYSPILKSLSQRALEGDNEKLLALGRLALRNKKFIEEAPLTDFKGDRVALDRWERSVASIQLLKSKHPSYLLGLNSEDLDEWKWVTYIFVHSGWTHFVGNMFFLLIFAGALELVAGGLAVLTVFLGSGVFAAVFFLWLSGVSAAPLVGASGAVSGLMAYYCFLYWNKPVRFLYWLFIPLRGYMGVVYLPGWVIFAMWMLSDLAGYLSTPSDLGGVAYTAHLGGELIGITMGIVVSLVRFKYAGHKLPADNVPMAKLFPFFPALPVKRRLPG